MALTFASVTDLVDALVAAEVRADLDPGNLNLPAAWVTVESVQVVNLAGGVALDVAVYLIAPDLDYARAMEDLADLFQAVVPAVLVPDGPVVPQGVVLPDSSTPLPALRVPVRLYESE